jgi:hypothetical protein
VVTAGVVTAGVVTAGVVTAGVVTAGVLCGEASLWVGRSLARLPARQRVSSVPFTSRLRWRTTVLGVHGYAVGAQTMHRRVLPRRC